MSENLGNNEIREIKNVPIKSFETKKCVYTYDNDRKTTTFNKETQEIKSRSDITVFVALDDDSKNKFLDVQNGNTQNNLKLCVLEKQDDGSPKEIKKREDILNEDSLYLGIIDAKTKERIFSKKASLIPTIESYVVEAKNVLEDGKTTFKTHLGDEVIKTNRNLNEVGEKNKLPKSFETERGSVYTYDNEGKTSRFKKVTGEHDGRSDITVFVNLTPEEGQFVLNAYHHVKDKYKSLKVYIYEKQSDNTAKTIEKREDIENVNNLGIQIYNKSNKKIIWFKEASLTPVVGYEVFDMRSFVDESGKSLESRHLGHKVTKINY